MLPSLPLAESRGSSFQDDVPPAAFSEQTMERETHLTVEKFKPGHGIGNCLLVSTAWHRICIRGGMRSECCYNFE